jgi:hypothetical protein
VFNEDTDSQFIGFRFAKKWNEKHEVGYLLSKVIENKTPNDLFESAKINTGHPLNIDDF